MNGKKFVIRRKLPKIERPPPVRIESWRNEHYTKPFDTAPRIKAEEPPPPSPPLPKFRNPVPDFPPADERVNAAFLYRGISILQNQELKEEQRKAEEPTQFLDWQAQMRAEDEAEKFRLVQKRREELEGVRKKAIKAKKRAIEERQLQGEAIRAETEAGMKQLQAEINAERQKIRELKAQMVDRAPIAVEAAKRKREEAAFQIKEKLREELKESQMRKREEDEAIKANAAKVRDQLKNHTNRHGDTFIQRKEITETKFLAALTDEEAQELIDLHEQQDKERIEKAIIEHKAVKQKKMEQLVAMLNEMTKRRAEMDAAFTKEQEEREAAEIAEQERKQIEQEEKVLILEKKLEKKRLAKIKEAEEADEITRQIAARNRYLALNKDALSQRNFQSLEDTKLRMARERQESQLRNPEDLYLRKKPKKKKELKGLNALLGV